MEIGALDARQQSQRNRRVGVVEVANESQRKTELVCISIVNWGDVQSVHHRLFRIALLHKV